MSDEQHLGAGHRPAEDPESRFLTDQDPLVDLAPETESLDHEPTSATVVAPADLSVLDERPMPRPPREYHFPAFERVHLAGGLTLITCHTPGRPLLAANLILPGGASAEPADLAGVSVLAGRALTEGTRRRDAIAFVEAAERLGAEIHADTSWDAQVAVLEVPRSRIGAALGLLAEMVLEPAFPPAEIDRLREERVNDLLQARADPRRRAERVFNETIYDPANTYHRPLAGTEATVPRVEREAVAERHGSALAGGGATLIVTGDLSGLPLAELAERHFGGWPVGRGALPPPAAEPHPDGPRVLLIDRPAAPQSELRIGHVGLARRTPDFHAVSVLNAILGGTFNSRLNRVLREERGYTYGISSGFEMRRAAGPFAVRTAVHSEATVAAVNDILDILRRMPEDEIEPAELSTARDYLVGVFPLRFEVPAQVSAALSGLVVQGLPDDELDRYRPGIAAVEAGDVLAAAARHVRPAEASIVIVGDATSLAGPLAEAGLPPITVVPADSAAEPAEAAA